MARSILVVDDEPRIRSLLRAYLEADGFSVTEAGTGGDAVRLATGDLAPDLVLLDIGLPDVDGFEALARIRRTSEVYVILVTARAEELDRLVGLELGADDYVTKPFSPREVVARVKAVLRRPREGGGDARGGHGAPSRDPTLRFVGLRIDPERRELTVDDSPVVLSTLEFDLLHALASSPGRVFSRAQLLEKVWGYDFYGDERVVDVHIRNMRRALGDMAADPRFIGTVRGVGYKLVAEPAAGSRA